MAAFEPPAKPIGVIDSITGGFELVSGRLWLIGLPIALDLGIWFGPRVSIQPIIDKLIGLLREQPMPDPSLQQAQLATLTQLGETYNVLTMLSTAPLGLPSLMAAKLSMATPVDMATPVGHMPVIALSNPGTYLLVALGCTLVGLLLGTAWFALIARQVGSRSALAGQHASDGLRATGWRFIVNVLQVTLFAVVLFIALFLFSIPYFLVITVLASITLVLGSLAGLAGAVIALWLGFYLAFVPHGIVARQRNVVNAVWDSVRLVQWNLTPTVILFTLVIAIYIGLNYVWTLPNEDSWMMLVGILGHSFIVTSLVSATFIFYQDRYRWWQENRQWVQEQLDERRRRTRFAIRTRQRRDDPPPRPDDDLPDDLKPPDKD